MIEEVARAHTVVSEPRQSASVAYSPDALTHGYTSGFFAGAALLILAALIVGAALITEPLLKTARATVPTSSNAQETPGQ